MNAFGDVVELTMEVNVLGRRVGARHVVPAESWDNPELRPFIEKQVQAALIEEVMKVCKPEISVRR